MYLFQGDHSSFLEEFNLHKSEMQEFLAEVEQCAKQLDKMKTGRGISAVVSSVLGAGGGVVFFTGLALIPFTAGASAILVGTGAGIGALSGGTSIATMAAHSIVNKRESKKASNAFDKFRDNMNTLQRCLNNIIPNSSSFCDEDPVVGNVRIGAKVASVTKCVDTFLDGVSAGTKFTAVGKTVGKTVAQGTMAISRITRVGFMAANALFIGLDIAMIVLSSIELHKERKKGIKPEVSKLIRARAGLRKSEIESWEKICESLEKGQQHFKEKQEILQAPFWVSRRSKQSLIMAAQFTILAHFNLKQLQQRQNALKFFKSMN